MSMSAGSGSPASLIAEARAGGPEALAALYLEHGAALFRLAYRLVGRPRGCGRRGARCVRRAPGGPAALRGAREFRRVAEACDRPSRLDETAQRQTTA